jgi:hypothetical protein
MLEDIMVSIDSWEYPTDFLVLQPKSNSMDILSSWEDLGWPQHMHTSVVEKEHDHY